MIMTQPPHENSKKPFILQELILHEQLEKTPEIRFKSRIPPRIKARELTQLQFSSTKNNRNSSIV